MPGTSTATMTTNASTNAGYASSRNPRGDKRVASQKIGTPTATNSASLTTCDQIGPLPSPEAAIEVDTAGLPWNDLVAAATFDSMRGRARDLAPEANYAIWHDDGAFFRQGGRRNWAELLSPDEVAAFEELVGCHGGIGGWQTEAVLVHPSRWVLSEPPVGSDAVHEVLIDWLEKLGQRKDQREPVESKVEA